MVQKSVVLTDKKDPYNWEASYDYPQWTWSRVFSWRGVYYEMEDPINIVWDDTNIGAVKSVMIDVNNWVDNPFEYTHYIYSQNQIRQMVVYQYQ